METKRVGYIRPCLAPESCAWRLEAARQVAEGLDLAAHGVVAVYLIGSVSYGDTGSGSDIDLVVHVRGTGAQTARLRAWLAGWDRRLCGYFGLLCGHSFARLLDVHCVTDADIQKGTSFASKIGSLYEPAQLLRRA